MLCADGFERPVIDGDLLLPDRQQVPVPFLLDTGADFTLLSHSVLSTLATYVRPREAPHVSSIAGNAPIVFLEVDLLLTTTEGRQLQFYGPVQALATPWNLELSVLGRDVIDHFDLAYSRTRHLLALLTAPHGITLTDFTRL